MTALALLACFLSLPVGIWIGWMARDRKRRSEDGTVRFKPRTFVNPTLPDNYRIIPRTLTS